MVTEVMNAGRKAIGHHKVVRRRVGIWKGLSLAGEKENGEG